jgi:hypothetical protein
MKARKQQASYNILAFLFLYIVFFLLMCGIIRSISINYRGGWSPLVSGANLLGPAGSDLQPSYESPSNAVSLDIIGEHFLGWELDVHREDIHWNPNIRLFIRRTSNGIGWPYLSGVQGGESYLEITPGDQIFCRGWGRRYYISFQLKAEGISARIPADSYSTNIVYTALDLD